MVHSLDEEEAFVLRSSWSSCFFLNYYYSWLQRAKRRRVYSEFTPEFPTTVSTELNKLSFMIRITEKPFISLPLFFGFSRHISLLFICVYFVSGMGSPVCFLSLFIVCVLLCILFLVQYFIYIFHHLYSSGRQLWPTLAILKCFINKFDLILLLMYIIQIKSIFSL